MSASTGPDGHSSTAQDHQASEDQDLTSQEERAFDYNPDYLPEREFVLMPLFRRIGEMLGLRRREEPQYLEAEPSEAATRTYSVEQEVDVQAAAPEPAHVVDEPLTQSPSLASQAQHELHNDPLGRDLLDIESDLPQPASVNRETEAEIELPAGQLQHAVEQPQQIVQLSGADEVQPTEAASREYAQSVEESAFQQSPAISVQPEDTSRLQPAERRPSAQEIQELVAPLREAAAKISAAVAQAAEWLRTKEEEILRRADVSQATTKPAAQNNVPSTVLPLEAHTLIASTPVEAEAEAPDAPGIQREAAWQRAAETVPQTERNQRQAPIYRNQDHPALRPRLELVPRPPFWRRINWAQEFTPQRVALLGGLAMAVLLVVGISLARRPASTVLPQQQQTRSLQPGGVTVTTHPTTAQQSPTQPVRRTTASQRSAPQRHRAQRAAGSEDSDPDVVTHYYNSKKPSPVKQTTVAGVRHYSDM